MSFDYITAKADQLVSRYKTRDPFELADELNIHVMYRTNFTVLKGMYKPIKRSRFIFLNANLTPELQRIVCAHELGHDRLHYKLATTENLSEISLFRCGTRHEYEANIFAAQLLLPTDDLLEYIKRGYSVPHIAAVMRTDENLLMMKLEYLRRQGYPIRQLEGVTNFLHS